jgi:hypothetical protein
MMESIVNVKVFKEAIVEAAKFDIVIARVLELEIQVKVLANSPITQELLVITPQSRGKVIFNP